MIILGQESKPHVERYTIASSSGPNGIQYIAECNAVRLAGADSVPAIEIPLMPCLNVIDGEVKDFRA